MYHARRSVSVSSAVPLEPARPVPPASSARGREAVQVGTAWTHVAGGEGGEEELYSLTNIALTKNVCAVERIAGKLGEELNLADWQLENGPPIFPAIQ